MTTEEIKNIVTSEHTRKYRVKLEDGTTKIVRLWLQDGKYPCIIGKRKKHYGHYLNWASNETKNWVSLKEVKKSNIDYKSRIIKRAKKAQQMLAESGLWPDIKREIDDFLSLTDEQIEEFVKAATTDFYNNVYKNLYEKNNKFTWLHTYQVFESFLRNICWKSPNFGRYWKGEKEQLRLAVENKRNYSRKWINGYDNSVSVEFNEDGARGWYSEEYRGCGNGHYYLLFDATHAIFYEDD